MFKNRFQFCYSRIFDWRLFQKLPCQPQKMPRPSLLANLSPQFHQNVAKTVSSPSSITEKFTVKKLAAFSPLSFTKFHPNVLLRLMQTPTVCNGQTATQRVPGVQVRIQLKSTYSQTCLQWLPLGPPKRMWLLYRKPLFDSVWRGLCWPLLTGGLCSEVVVNTCKFWKT